MLTLAGVVKMFPYLFMFHCVFEYLMHASSIQLRGSGTMR